jgi:hypothetical protein
MNTQNKSRVFLFVLIIGLAVIILAGIGLSLFVLDEVSEEGLAAPNFMRAFFPFGQNWPASTGDEFTGEATAWLFGASMIPVGLDLIFRFLLRLGFLGEASQGFIKRINCTQKKYLMPLHTYLSILALGFGILHLTRSSCALNPLPEIGLYVSGALVVTGLLIKWKVVPKSIFIVLYKLHTSLIVSGVLLVILVAGHSVMGLD